MHESMSIKSNTEYASANPSSPIEDALERMYHQGERVQKAFAVLTDRLGSVLQPEEPHDLDAISGEKSGVPRSLVVNRLVSTADDLSRLANRIERVTDRLDA